MDFFQPGNVLPKPWSLFTGYTIAPLSQLLNDLDPVNANKIEDSFRARLEEAGVDTENSKWASIMASKVIYPTPGATESYYDAWLNPTSESFEHFADLWRNENTPSDQGILKWVHTHGLPCTNSNLDSLSLTEFYAIKIPKMPSHTLPTPESESLAIENRKKTLLISMSISTLFQSAVDDYARFKYPSDVFRWKNIMFRDVFIKLCKEAYSVLIVYAQLKSGGTADGLSAPLKIAVLGAFAPVGNANQAKLREEMMPRKIFLEDDFYPFMKNKYLPFNDAVQMGSFIVNIINDRLSRLRLTLQRIDSKNMPFVVLDYAFQAEDLLTVMWAGFYNMIISNKPIARCFCGKVFTKSRPNQKYCDKYCQNRLNQQKYRGRNKATTLTDAQ